VTNVNTTVVRNIYVNTTVVNNLTVNNNTTVNRVSYNGGPGGVTATPTAEELAARKDEHVPATSVQRQHQRIASADRNNLASVNHGMPANAAVAEPLSRDNRPAGFERLQPQDRAAASEHLVNAHAGPSGQYGSAPGHAGGNPYATNHPVRSMNQAPPRHHAPAEHHVKKGE
jgi:hypothetical protein